MTGEPPAASDSLACTICESAVKVQSNHGKLVVRCTRRDDCGAEWDARGNLVRKSTLEAKMPDSVKKVDTRVRRR